MVAYEYDGGRVKIEEANSGGEYEFRFQMRDDELLRKLKMLRAEVENNSDLTDVVFGTQAGQVYVANVRSTFRTEFLLLCFKYEILSAVKRV